MSKFIKYFPKDFVVVFAFITAFNAYYHTSIDFLMNLALNLFIFLVCGCCIAAIRRDNNPKRYEVYVYIMAIIAAAAANYFYVPISELNKATLALVSVVAAIPLAIGMVGIFLRGAGSKIDRSLQGNKRLQNVFGILLLVAALVCIGTFIVVTR
ncbi:hypothetical protein ALP22_200217 [Pseudomonas coronafaciens pv. porri]|uniref:hypothetical protein n=1 Tax=Pseudomonas syringae group TaxID=136849 RepID=UPI000EFFAD38|nr:hypothetical protein [Pseudomonas coronafaciens]RMU86520.1 hypothetical protein ALP22_200217 [Pseudomonas coronafaciens pv. porri]